MPIDLVHYFIDAYEMVSAWNLSDEELADAIKQQAYLIAGIDPDNN